MVDHGLRTVGLWTARRGFAGGVGGAGVCSSGLRMLVCSTFDVQVSDVSSVEA